MLSPYRSFVGICTNRKRYCNFLNECNKVNDDHDILVQPRAGMALISDHCIFHEGLHPSSGTKYVLRTDVIHEREMKLHPKIRETLT